jgi:hypothetical protein
LAGLRVHTNQKNLSEPICFSTQESRDVVLNKASTESEDETQLREADIKGWRMAFA